MLAKLISLLTISLLSLAVTHADEPVLFEDNFNGGMSEQWQIVGLSSDDYRIKDGGLEVRVQSHTYTRESPMIKVILPFTSSNSVIASVDVEILDKFTASDEMVGMFLLDESGREFSATKARIDRKLVFAPPAVNFIGETGHEDDFSNYAYTYHPASEKSETLRIILRSHYAYFQVGPNDNGKYQNFFYSAIRKNSKERGFCLCATGAPEGAEHWVRFDNFRVTQKGK